MELLLIVLVIVIVGLGGYLTWHRYHNSYPTDLGFRVATYKYSGYVFPYVPSSFVLKTKSPTQTNPQLEYPEIAYTSKDSLRQIEIDIVNICKYNNYPLDGGVNVGSSYSSEPNSQDENGTIYSLQCSTNNNSWDFYVDNNSHPSYWLIDLEQGGQPLCAGAAVGPGSTLPNCGTPNCHAITVDGDSACK